MKKLIRFGVDDPHLVQQEGQEGSQRQIGRGLDQEDLAQRAVQLFRDVAI